MLLYTSNFPYSMIPNALTGELQEFRRPVSELHLYCGKKKKKTRKEEDQEKAEMTSGRLWFVVLRKNIKE